MEASAVDQECLQWVRGLRETEASKVMDQLIDFLLRSVLAALVGAGFLALVFRHTATRWIDSRFDKRLLNHKHELARLIERERFEFNRGLQAHTHYAEKKHRRVNDLYLKLLEADGRVGRLETGYYPTFESWGEADFRGEMEERHFPLVMQEDILRAIDENRHNGLEELRRRIRESDTNVAWSAWRQASNARLLALLYISNQSEEDSGELLDLLKSQLMALRYEHREPPSDEEIEEAKTRVRNTLVSELRSSEDVI